MKEKTKYKSSEVEIMIKGAKKDIVKIKFLKSNIVMNISKKEFEEDYEIVEAKKPQTVKPLDKGTK